MKKVLFVLCLGLSIAAHAQQAQNINIVTTDGFRWQDLFKGMDDTIAQKNVLTKAIVWGLSKSMVVPQRRSVEKK